FMIYINKEENSIRVRYVTGVHTCAFPIFKRGVHLMKCKKLLALVMAAVLSVSMLTASGGGSNGVSGSLDQNEVNSLLKNNAGSNAQIVRDGDLDDAVKAGAAQIVSTGNANSASAVVANEMGWDFVSVASQLINSIKNSGGVTSIGTSFGITYVIEE